MQQKTFCGLKPGNLVHGPVFALSVPQAENITTYIQTLDIHSNIHNMYTQKALIGNEMWRNCKVTYSR